MLHCGMPYSAKKVIGDARMALNRRFILGVWTVKQSSIPYRESMMLGMAKVVFSILLSGMMAIGRAMESGRRGYGSSSGWKVFEFFWLG
ncbi:hypothetical protein TNCV_4395881 [Trichonephila clavipes]|uniref:Uncharacterized protein n=1 Tax=Trichonephila clavipes TaxID=2585209 RepID=A0A8X6W4Z9_TRICX|nr:hypothetical protein TNCV_4395881 [Trichonephila clavipes]